MDDGKVEGCLDGVTDGAKDGKLDGEDEGLRLGTVLGELLGCSMTWVPPPHWQQAKYVFFPLYHTLLKSAQKLIDKSAHRYPLTSSQM